MRDPSDLGQRRPADAHYGRDTAIAAAIFRLIDQRDTDDVGTTASRGLPLSELRPKRDTAAYYALSSIDVWGRIADRSALHALRWGPASSLAISVLGEAIVVFAQPAGKHVLGRQGHLRLPASVRHACQIGGGDRLLLVALADRDLLLVHTMPALELMLQAYYGADPTAVPQ
jgi:hypothetical protein